MKAEVLLFDLPENALAVRRCIGFLDRLGVAGGIILLQLDHQVAAGAGSRVFGCRRPCSQEGDKQGGKKQHMKGRNQPEQQIAGCCEKSPAAD